jgi:hypothetical protein
MTACKLTRATAAPAFIAVHNQPSMQLVRGSGVGVLGREKWRMDLIGKVNEARPLQHT